ncbi:adenine phosphoribosyltransferase [Lacimicrobium alkaliphilum]|uniref:Adenine phosphoribosyltransferase n=1 Tax=Lacimicrobium alkaliphilum TaxID=1526571 RepID=A0ABQ1R2Y6_9ALTE|nr:adenine phosphoribosyltransferase [Lacimicrobium alkaliphilum]GGD56176.1 adenine phosphoribosyltransferase [Lacimicrobium alkaliphilum]
MSAEYIKSVITTVPDYPRPGVQFRDVTSVMQDKKAFASCIDLLAEHYQSHQFDKIAGTEARGFIFGAPLAKALGAGFVPVRKFNKLPRAVIQQSYELEYGSDVLELHRDAIGSNEKVLLLDDLLATGGTMLATATLVRQLGGIVEHAAFVINLPDLGGAAKLSEQKINCHFLCEFEGD